MFYSKLVDPFYMLRVQCLHWSNQRSIFLLS